MPAVLSAHVLNSSRVDPAQELELLSWLESLLRSAADKQAFYRADSFQACISDAAGALRLVLLRGAQPALPSSAGLPCVPY